MSLTETFATRLRASIKAKYGTFSRAAEVSGIPRERLSEWCLGRRSPTLTSVQRVMDALSLGQDELLGNDEKKQHDLAVPP